MLFQFILLNNFVIIVFLIRFEVKTKKKFKNFNKH